MKSLLIMGCSQRKAEMMRGAAWSIYDGHNYRCIKERLREFPAWREALDILIVSAKYGVIPFDREIENYDQRLAIRYPEERGLIGAEWSRQLRRLIAGKVYSEVRVDLGRDYLDCFAGLGRDLAMACGGHAALSFSEGRGIGAKASQTAQWAWEQVRLTGQGAESDDPSDVHMRSADRINDRERRAWSLWDGAGKLDQVVDQVRAEDLARGMREAARKTTDYRANLLRSIEVMRSAVAEIATPLELAGYLRRLEVATWPNSPEYIANYWNGVLVKLTGSTPLEVHRRYGARLEAMTR